MTEPEEPTFSVIVLAFTKSADDLGQIHALAEAFKFGTEEARGIIERVPLRVKRGADPATTRQLAGQLLALGAELCIQNEQTGVEKLYYPGSGFGDDDAPASRESAPSSGPRKQVDPGAPPRRSTDPGASMRDALRLARQRAQGEGGAPVSARQPAGTQVSPSIPPSASVPPPPSADVPSQPPPIELSPHAAPLPRPVRKRGEREAEERAEAQSRMRKRLAIALAALLAVAGAAVTMSVVAPKPMIVEVAGRPWKAALPPGATEGEASSTTLLTELGPVRMMARTASGGGPLLGVALAHLTFTTPPKLDGAALDKLVQHAVDDLAPGGKLGPSEAWSQGKFTGKQARFAGAHGAPFGKVRAFQVPGGDIALLLIVGASEGAADGTEGSAWMDSFSGAP